MTKTTATWLHAAGVLALALTVTASGCKSSSTSRWAWNPWSKSKADAEALAETAPKLPTDGATPQIEGLAPATGSRAKTTPSVATLAQGATPPAVSGMSPAISALASVAPKGPAPSAAKPTAPAQSAYPTATTPAAPTAPPKASIASTGGPYDPNGYKPAGAQVASASQSAGRYGDRYASTAPADNASPFGELPPLNSVAKSVGDRYASTTAAPAAKAEAAANQFAQQAGATADRYAAAANQTADRYATAPGEANQFAQSLSKTAVESISPPPASPDYPSTTSLAAAADQAKPSATIGNLPPSTSVYAATPPTTPVTPIEPATAETTTGDQGSVVRLTTLPGEYRPGGTSTYKGNGASSPTSRY